MPNQTQFMTRFIEIRTIIPLTALLIVIKNLKKIKLNNYPLSITHPHIFRHRAEFPQNKQNK